MKSTLLINSFDGIDRNKTREPYVVNALWSRTTCKQQRNARGNKIVFYEIINKAVHSSSKVSNGKNNCTHCLCVCASICVRAHIIRSHLVACLPILGRYTFYRYIYNIQCILKAGRQANEREWYGKTQISMDQFNKLLTIWIEIEEEEKKHNKLSNSSSSSNNKKLKTKNKQHTLMCKHWKMKREKTRSETQLA